MRLGLFDKPVWDYSYPEFGSEQFAKESYAAALESEVLLKNNGVLPLKEGARILVTGPNANTLRALNGGWSYTWQGNADAYVPQYKTIFQALFDRYPGKVAWVPGVVYDHNNWQKDFAINIQQAKDAVGQPEGAGKSPGCYRQAHRAGSQRGPSAPDWRH